MNMKQKRRTHVRGLLLCYLAALVLWGVMGTVTLAFEAVRRGNGAVAETELSLQEAERENVQQLPGWDETAMWIYSATPDPQLIWRMGGQPVGLLRVNAEAVNRPGGEMVLYYTTREGEPFSEARKRWAQQDEAGRMFFDLGGKRVHALRLDPGAVAGVIWKVNALTLNPRRLWWQFYRPDVQAAALLLLAPLLVWATVYELWAFLQPLLVRRRFERRWQGPRATKGQT